MTICKIREIIGLDKTVLMEIIQIADWMFSVMLMSSFLFASVRGEKFNSSLQYNAINIITSCAFVIIAIYLGTYGCAVRQGFFALISGVNLLRRHQNIKLLKKGNGRA
ncbi:MAG: hypothetical protein WCG45_01490 [bacterium]